MNKHLKASIERMSDSRRLEVTAQFTDDVLSKLADAFFQVVQQEGWGKRDLSSISGINETAVGHILAGRRKNLTVETIALLTRAMRKRPELTLHDLRPKGNNPAKLLATQRDSTSVAITNSSEIVAARAAPEINSTSPAAAIRSFADA
jgi:hypothetical protein